MMKSIKVSAPGKLMLFGEHAVVYGKPCIVTSLSYRFKLEAKILKDSEFILDAPQVDIKGYKKSIDDLGSESIPKGAKYVEMAVRHFDQKYKLDSGIHIKTESEFSPRYGFGSSAAAVVCTFQALAKLFDKKLTKGEIFALSYKTVLATQGRGSGFDIAAAVYGGTVYFVKGREVVEKLTVDKIPLLIGYSGIKADTMTMIKKVADKRKRVRRKVEKVFDDIGKLVSQAKQSIIEKDWRKVGQLMNVNQHELVKLGVSSKKLDELIKVVRQAGAWGAKLSGAGGGDCMVTIGPADKRDQISKAIEQAGGEIIDVEANAEEIKVES